MPDFERLHRSMALHRADENQRPVLTAYREFTQPKG